MTNRSQFSIKATFVVILALLLLGINGTARAADNSIVDIAVADGRFTTLVAAAQAGGVADLLENNGPFTVFAPTDDAFAKLPAGTVEALLADPSTLRQILLYHMVQGDVRAETVVGLSSATTALGKDVSIEVRDGSVFLNGDTQVIITDIVASNGVIHVIDTVLLPPANPTSGQTAPPPADEAPAMPSIVDIAVADGRFTTLVAAAQAAGVADLLSNNGPFTVFAPTDAAFAKLPAGTVEALLADPSTLRQILLYHMVQGDVRAADVVGLSSAPTALGKNIDIAVVDGGVQLNGNSNVIITDIAARNGVIHVIDTVLLPPAGGFAGSGQVAPPAPQPEADMPSIVDVAVADGRFTTLVAAVQAAGLADMLDNNGPFTVFAPTDAAFAKLPAGTVEALVADPDTLRQILLYHIVQGDVRAETVVGLNSATTALGKDVAIEVRDGNVFINGNTQVIITDIVVGNGVIHVIDTVLLP